jgi:lysophospholipid acyltransferase (LPLAT)-like uncharacterized protein
LGDFTLGQRTIARAVGAFTTALFTFTARHARHACRWHLRGPLDAAVRSGAPFVLAAWHQDVLPLFHYLALHHIERPGRYLMMSSRSFDGEVTERVLRPFGFDFVRGSAGKEGARTALRELQRAARAGRRIVLIADGPVPPPYRLRPGPVQVARHSGLPLFVARAWSRPQQVVPRTWFRMTIPLPRSDIAVFSAGPIDVGGEFEEARSRAEAALHELGRQVDGHLYLTPRPPPGVRFEERAV